MFIIEATDRNDRYRQIGTAPTMAEAVIMANDAVTSGNTTHARIIRELATFEKPTAMGPTDNEYDALCQREHEQDQAIIHGDHIWDAFQDACNKLADCGGVLPSQPQD